MIHIATVHHDSADWIELQHEYLHRFITEPFRIYASLEGISSDYGRFFDVVVPSVGQHMGKLNLLGYVILEDADDDDLIVFLDGDAFPVADPIGPARALLEDNSLTAVCRTENAGDRQPHPCFCAVPAAVWRELPGDWSSGYCYSEGHSDVGANLLYLLEKADMSWAPILRSNRYDLHPVFFGVYGGFLYHHGAGFRRTKVTRADWLQMRHELESDGSTPTRELVVARGAANARLSEQVFAEIQSNRDFFRRFV
jgi:hypothetical protein